MPRTFTLSELVSRLEKMCDIESDSHFSTAEKQEIIASAAAETWDCMLRSGMGEKKVQLVTFNTTAGTSDYDLTSATYVPNQDFYKVSQVYVDEGNGQYRPLDRINQAEVLTFRAPPTVVPIRLHYIPCAPTFKVAGVFSGSATFDGISGWEEHTLNTAACTVKAKREEDGRFFYQRKKELEDRIAFMGRTDHSGPSRVIRRRYRNVDPFSIYRNQCNAYIIRGDKLTLLYHYGYTP